MRVGDRPLSKLDILAYVLFAALIVAMLLVPVR